MNELDGTVSLKAFLDGTADGACAVNSEGVIDAWNAAAEKIFRCRAKKAVGRLCREILDARDAAGNSSCSEFCTVRNHFTRREPLRHFELRSKTDVGDPVWLDVSVLLG